MLSNYLLREKNWADATTQAVFEMTDSQYIVPEEKQAHVWVVYWGRLAESDNPSFLAMALRIPAQSFGRSSFKQICIEDLSCARYVQRAEGAEMSQRMHS